VGDAGVGGGGCGERSFDFTVEMGASASRVFVADGLSVSVSEPLESSSQLSATGFDFGACAVFCGIVEESSRCLRVETMSIIDKFGVAVDRDACSLPSSLGVLFMEAMVWCRVPVQIDEYRYPSLRGVYRRKRGNRNQGEREVNEGISNYSTV
jgi:hypothetical protein